MSAQCSQILPNAMLFTVKSQISSDMEAFPNDNRQHGLWTPREEISFTARPKIQSQSQIFRYSRSIFCLPHWPNFSNIFDLYLHWVSVVRVLYEHKICMQNAAFFDVPHRGM